MFSRIGLFLLLPTSLLAQDFRGAPGQALYRRSTHDFPILKRGKGYQPNLLQEIFDEMVCTVCYELRISLTFRVVTMKIGNDPTGEPTLRNEEHRLTKYRTLSTAMVTQTHGERPASRFNFDFIIQKNYIH